MAGWAPLGHWEVALSVSLACLHSGRFCILIRSLEKEERTSDYNVT